MFNIKIFIDFDKKSQKFYVNHYLDDYNVVLKIAICNDEESDSNLKIEKLDLTKYVYLIHYD